MGLVVKKLSSIFEEKNWAPPLRAKGCVGMVEIILNLFPFSSQDHLYWAASNIFFTTSFQIN